MSRFYTNINFYFGFYVMICKLSYCVLHAFIVLIICNYKNFRYISSKEIDPSFIDVARVMVVAVCMIKENFPRSIFTSQLHVMVYIVDEMAICGVVHA